MLAAANIDGGNIENVKSINKKMGTFNESFLNFFFLDYNYFVME